MRKYLNKIVPLLKSRVLFLAIVVLLIRITSLSYVFIMLVFYSFLKTIIIGKGTYRKRIFSFMKSVLFMVLFYSLYTYLGAWGAIFGLVLISVYFIWKGMPTIIEGRNTIETMIFGKTLDKENWVDTRPKLKKIKWKKEKQQKQ